jgi:hypothetical protein
MAKLLTEACLFGITKGTASRFVSSHGVDAVPARLDKFRHGKILTVSELIMFVRASQITLLSAGLMAFCQAALAESPVSFIPLEQKARILEYPDISLNQMDYRGIFVEYMISGHVAVRGVKKVMTPINCPEGPRQVAQLEVSYDTPVVTLRVKDVTRNAHRFSGALPNQGKTFLGDATCGATNDLAALEANFNANKEQFIKSIKQKELNAVRERVDTFVQENTVVVSKPFDVTSFQFRSDSGDFTNLNQAYDIATKAYAMIEDKGVLVEPSEGIKGAIELWEMAMGNPIINSRSDAKKIKAAVAYNLSSAYLIAMNYMQASAYHKLAKILNAESGNTLKFPDNQARIDRQLRNRSLSNTVPNNVVALVTLERMGKDYLRRATATELDPIAFKEKEFLPSAEPITTASLED